MRCKTCGEAQPLGSRECPGCGAPQEPSSVLSLHGMDAAANDPNDRADGDSTPAKQAPNASAAHGSSAGTNSDRTRPGVAATGRFAPGEVLAERFRVVQMLGEGGMGEVYRVDDLSMGQPVALKLLRPELANDPALKEHLRSEVRLARRVTHPNVCRVHDLGEFEDQSFLTMEFVAGEDLASLLRRGGRPSAERALAIARQVCAGLAAAHAQGVLHRDLKPANVLVDADGQIKLTDFGLALDAGEDAGNFSGAGTPGYMAPEQLEGAAANKATDLYSLGVLLWELFTGERFAQGGQGTTKKAARVKPLQPLSELVPEIDHDQERVVMQCLARNASARPHSALAVLAAFTGSDMLTAALGVGEVPTPELVAAAGEHGALGPRKAALLGVLGLLLLAVVVLLDGLVTVEARSELPLEPAVLVHRAQEILRSNGLPADAVDSSHGFGYLRGPLRWLSSSGQDSERWDRLKEPGPPGIFFWYRESPNVLLASNSLGRVSVNDPSIQTDGQRMIWLSPRGELLFLTVAPPLPQGVVSPPDSDSSSMGAGSGDGRPSRRWQELFAFSGFEGSLELIPEAGFTAPFANDQETMWKGLYPGIDDLEVNVLGAEINGTPVYYQVVVPGMWVYGRQPLRGGRSQSPETWVAFVFSLAMLLGGSLLARRHWSRGWGDRTGALRLFFLVLGLSFASWILGAHHFSFLPQELTSLERFLAAAIFEAALVWVVYLAIEPIVRRHWPERIVAWSRLVAGRWRDPLVGRSIVSAVFVALLVQLTSQLSVYLGWHLGEGQQLPIQGDISLLGQPRMALAALFETVSGAVLPALGFVVLLVLLRMLVRVEQLAALVVVFVGLALRGNRETAGYLPLDLPVVVIQGALMYFLLVRQDLLTFVVSISCILIMWSFPMLPNLGSWHATSTWMALAYVGGLLLVGLRIAAPRLRLGA